ncbi:MAG: protein kinase [Paucibacter sp.]|nr:protein kinase [Roseateles sp.]
MSNDQDDDRTVIRPSGFSPSSLPSNPPPSSFAPTQAAGPPSVLPSMGPPSTIASSAGESGNALPVGTFLAEFELLAVLGEGGFGIVYQAWDHSLERRVALKEYMPSSLAARTGDTTVQVKSERHRETFDAGRKSFVNEAKLLAQFDHPALVKVYRFWEANGTAYMVMPLYEGITLKDHLKTLTAPPDEAWLLGVLGPLTEALGVIHHEQCFHRDIAPDNVILLGGNGARPLLLDFGAARRVIGDMTQALTVILKPGYAPVEQYAEAPHMKQGAWTDVYALAASVHFALIGKTPPPSVSRMMGDPYQPLAESALKGRYSERFLRAIDKALIVKPDERTQSIAELRDDLGLVAGQGAPTMMPTQMPARAAASPASPREAARQPAAGKSKAPLIAVAAVAVIGAGAAGYFLTRPATAPAPSQTATNTAPANAQAPAPAPAPAPVPPHFDARQQFESVVTQQSPGFQVSAAPALATLRVDKDKLNFSIRSERAGYVNVLLLGPDGSLLQLFPNAKVPTLRIDAGQTLKLPGKELELIASEPLGTEHFLVTVSEQPRDFSMFSTEREDPYLKLPTGARADAFLAAWSRSTPMLLGTAPKDCQGTACDAYGAVVFTMEIVK